MKVLGTRIDAVDYTAAKDQIMQWSRIGETRYICAANVHMVMETYDSVQFREIVNCADLVTPDGMPLVWMMRAKCQRKQTRVYGPTLMLHIVDAATRDNLPVGFYGSKPEVLKALGKRLQTRYARLNIAFSYSPPFRETNTEEDAAIIDAINKSGAKILFVGLGCPKQEIWMSEHHGKVNAVMVGVGAAFDFHAGLKPQAPDWMQTLGLEWLFRLGTEPRRLWKRYLYHNPRFVFLAVADLLGLLKKVD